MKSIERAIDECLSRVDIHTWSGVLKAKPLYKIPECFGVEDSPIYSTVLCNDEINMGFLAANMASRPFGSETLEMGIILDTAEDEIETARKALSS
ncbi:MAG: hypothetical protein ACOCT7_00930 [Candidatus Saliniplasma sp.]